MRPDLRSFSKIEYTVADDAVCRRCGLRSLNHATPRDCIDDLRGVIAELENELWLYIRKASGNTRHHKKRSTRRSA